MDEFLVSLVSMLGGIIFFFMFISAILFVIFGQVTVRKLRKNPETRQALGMEFASGWDILNVAQALSVPKSLEKKFKNKALRADADLLYKHTTLFDRVLAHMFFWTWVFSGFALILLMVVDWIWNFD